MRLLSVCLLFLWLLCGCDQSPRDTQDTSVVNARSTSAVAASEQASQQPGLKGATSAEKLPTGHQYVGAETCAGCHQSEYQSWRGSHHDLAMKRASAESIVADFNNTEFTYFGKVSRFYQQGEQYFVRTQGADGELEDYPISYTFGVYPLQQYLVDFPDGRMQALSIAWDSRSKAEGGQRWFHLYPDEEIKPGDPLHWTGLNQNWNFMCADCHSTNFQKNYDMGQDTFASTWSEINVGCEACHGPASRHVAWASAAPTERAAFGDRKGLVISFADRAKASWPMQVDAGIARLVKGENSGDIQREIPVCAQCHSRRSTVFPGARPDSDFLDHFNPALLHDGLYHADGQINDEVYVYGSFLQSKMHAAGVTCSNCHNPHTLKVRAEGNALCAQCHLPEKFDTAAHHLHPAGGDAAQCVSCHMPDKIYMQVDARRDHSFRVPRPDLSEALGVPNVCVDCHQDKSAAWAAAVLEKQFGEPEPHYGEALYAGRIAAPDAEGRLLQLLMDDTEPEIVRATAASLLPRYLSQTSAQVLQVIAQGDDALLHLGLAQALETVPPRVRPALAIPLLYEDERAITSLAANAMAAAPMEQYPEEVGAKYRQGLQDYQVSELFNSDRPESRVNLAGLYFQQGKLERSEQFFRDAIELQPAYSPAYINFADFYRATDREEESEAVLRKALASVRDKTPVQHSLGLSLVRQQKMEEALSLLQAAAHSNSASPRYIYVYAIALNSTGQPLRAIEELERGLKIFPQDAQMNSALISIRREQSGKP